MRYLFLLSLVLTGYFSSSQSNPQLFNSDSALQIVLKFSADSVYSELCTDPKYHPGILRISATELHVRVRKRGKFRCDRRNCANPPLLVNFARKEVKETIFNHQDKLKLVMPCKPGSKEHVSCLLKEYLAYKIFNIITPFSFKVRLIDLALVSTKDGVADTTRMPAFFIEDDDALAIRSKGKIWNASGVSALETDKSNMVLVDLFQYMIGNTDWSVTEPHNIELLSTNPHLPPIMIPYDFDWSGLVSAPYAIPNPKYELANVRQRLFLGYCQDDSTWKAAFKTYREKKPAIDLLIHNADFLTESTRKRMLKYLDDFWDIVDDPSYGIKLLNRECMEVPKL